MNIHILTASLKTNSGYANVARYLGLGLVGLGHNVNFTGLQTVYQPEYSYGFEILPVNTRYIDDRSQYLLNIQNSKTDIAINIFQSDLPDMNGFAKLFKKTIFYTTIEGERIPRFSLNDFVDILKNGGMVVFPTKFAQREMEKGGIKNIPVIPYGYNDKIFKPLNLKDKGGYCYYGTEVGKCLSDPMVLRKIGCYDCGIVRENQCNCSYFKEEIVSILKWSSEEKRWIQDNVPISKLKDDNSFKGKFIFLSVGHAMGVRKRHERLLKAYSIFLNMSKMYKDRTHLNLHTVPISIDGGMGNDLIEEIRLLGIENNVSFTYGKFGPSGWSEEGMSILYNIADCHVSASSGEGFCMPVLESMACGKPQIATNFTSFPELIGEEIIIDNINGIDNEKIGPRGLLVKCTPQMTQTTSYKALIDEEDMARCMKLIYNMKDEDIKIYSKNAIKFAARYQWSEIWLEWNKLLNDMK